MGKNSVVERKKKCNFYQENASARNGLPLTLLVFTYGHTFLLKEIEESLHEISCTYR